MSAIPERAPALQGFLDGLHAAIRAGSAPAGPAARAAERIFDALREPGTPGETAPARLPALTCLPEALSTARGGAGPIAAIADSFAAIEPSLAWYRRAGAGNASASFTDGHANASIIGPTGIEARTDVWVGVSLMAPGVRYPDHQHPPEEVYVVLSPGEWRQGDGAWFEPGVGGIVHNPPDILHAMRSDTVPLLAAWCLWLGDN